MVEAQAVKDRIDIVNYIGGYVDLKKSGRNYTATCPFHAETKPSFVVSGERQAWHCFGSCQSGGDVIKFAELYHGLDFPGALQELARYAGISNSHGNYHDSSDSNFKPRRPRPPENAARDADGTKAALNPDWQSAALDFVEVCYQTLFTATGDGARHYLNGRGLNDMVLRAGGVGFNPKSYYSRWGNIEVYLPRAIVLPTFFNQMPVRVKFRTATGDYRQATGGMDSLQIPFLPFRPGCHVVLVESELDALSIPPGIGVVPVALGGSGACRTLRNVARLAQAATVLIATDNDKAGDEAAEWWGAHLPNARRLRPTAHDVNDMLRTGHPADLVDWIHSATPETEEVFP